MLSLIIAAIGLSAIATIFSDSDAINADSDDLKGDDELDNDLKYDHQLPKVSETIIGTDCQANEGDAPQPEDPAEQVGSVSISWMEGKSQVRIDALPGPLADWSQDDFLPTVEAEASKVITIDFPADTTGTIHVLEAKYEQSYLSSGDVAVDTHCGWNIYFVPYGSEFPDKYVWSESGAALFNKENAGEDPGDFGETRTLLRIDGGNFGLLEDSGELIFDNRVTMPKILSNLPVIWR